ncbi:MAG: ribosome assembly cofactor RimP [Bacteroidales bacterium]|nr:ribosome assembly cofactor RimP [Bacteroidales bacterium]
MAIKEKIEEIVNTYLEGTDKFLISAEVSKSGLVEVFIDGDRDIAIDDCVKLSRHIGSFFDREEDDFELRVSSAGIDKPFVNIRQYRKYLNRAVEVTTGEGLKHEGLLVSLDEKGITLQGLKKTAKNKQNETVTLAFGEILKARPAIIF